MITCLSSQNSLNCPESSAALVVLAVDGLPELTFLGVAAKSLPGLVMRWHG